jgi:hypothetical protein
VANVNGATRSGQFSTFGMRLQAPNYDRVTDRQTHRMNFLRHAVFYFLILPWRSEVTLKLCGPRAGHVIPNRVARIPSTCVSGTAPLLSPECKGVRFGGPKQECRVSKAGLLAGAHTWS